MAEITPEENPPATGAATPAATGPAAPAKASEAAAATDVDASPHGRNAGRRRRVFSRMDSPFRTGFLLTLGGLTALVLGLAVQDLVSVIIYIVVALFISLGLNPVVVALQKRGMGRPAAVATAFGLVIAAIALLLSLVIPTVVDQIAQFVQSVPAMVRDFQGSGTYAWLEESFSDSLAGILADIQAFLTNPGNIAAIGGGALQVGASLLNAGSGLIVILVLALYFLASLPQMTAAMYTLAPARDRGKLAELTEQITGSVGSYVGGMIILAFINGSLVGILYFTLGLPFALLMGVAALCITLIPMIGTVLFWVIGTGMALFTGLTPAIIFAIAYLIYMQIEAYVMTPRIMNRAVSVPGPLVIISAVAGGTLMGLLGAFIAIPVTASILLIIRQVWVPRQNAKV
ncbi:hypothetical protein ART_2914 [Arthrobacter sp. PAMC 25486]|uniref:AI-2E family transporter n=1 Tax=Arthrobacter sp. PAMC 25486 TaxID=1494608 RepID=UPI0005363DAD|nr:AI-2E family transporter [Arthrobacter sp. PAMC 25486]AIY02513.1 hypothetical protein ART_2914 [Arthrobacter sp. PAMC 25486]